MPLLNNVISFLKNININNVNAKKGLNDNNNEMHLINDNEIVYCKNNVCVHPANNRDEYECLHHPGYLKVTVKTFVDQYNYVNRPTLFLDWVPNATLRNQPNNFENLLISNDQLHISNENSETTYDDHKRDAAIDRIKCTNPFLLNGLKSFPEEADEEICISVDLSDPEIKIVASPSSDTIDTQSTLSETSDRTTPTAQLYTTSSGAYSNSISSSPIFPNKKRDTTNTLVQCRRFSVDLSHMRSLRLFFNDEACTSGQLVIISRESQYKVLHFYHGGLDRLAHILHQWHSSLHKCKKESKLQQFKQKINHNRNRTETEPSLYTNFILVCRPEISQLELHPEEGKVPKLTIEMFKKMLNSRGQVEDDLLLRKIVFFTGIERDLRKVIWSLLLQCYSYQSTFEERAKIVESKKIEYEEINRRKSELYGSQLTSFKHRIENIVEKDVIRTDRANPFFAGIDNTNLDKMKNILLNYAVYNSVMGYSQGMSDLLAPVLCEMKDEVATFWCFVGLMQRATFVATPTDRDMDRNLKYLKELVRIMVPKFHEHIQKQKDASELLFCHRWILLCFKREFTEAVALRMWEACWANYLTDYFHLFLCLAIISVYADDVVAQNLKSDEMLSYFSSLAMYMDGKLICRKARGLLYQFRQLREIPCTLSGLCQKCGPGIWDSYHNPRIFCTGHTEFQNYCPNYNLN